MDFGNETALLFNHGVFARISIERYLSGGRIAGTSGGQIAEEQVHAGLSAIFHRGVRSLQIDQVPNFASAYMYSAPLHTCPRERARTYRHARMHSGIHPRMHPSMGARAPTRMHAHTITTLIDRIRTRRMEGYSCYHRPPSSLTL